MQKKTVMPKGGDFLPGIPRRKLEEMHKAEKNHKAKSRLLVLVMRKDGDAIRGIERTLHLPYSTIRNWLVRAVGRGLDGIYDQKRSGPVCRLDPDQLARLRDDLIAGPRACGFGHGVQTTRRVAAHVEKKYGAQYAERGMYDLLNRMGFSSRRPRPRHPRAASRYDKSEFKKKLVERPNTIPERATR